MENENQTNQTELPEVVTLITVDGMMEAQIIQSQLENFGIPCMQRFEAVGRVLGITTDGLGKVEIMVPPDYLDKAREILEAESAAQPED